MDDLGKRIKDKRKIARLSAEDLAHFLNEKGGGLNITKENIYSWQKGADPSNPDELAILREWLNDSGRFAKKLEQNNYNDDYVQLLKSQLEEMKGSIKVALDSCSKQLNQVTTNLSQVSTNLNDVSQNVTLGRADVRAFGKYQVMKDANNNPKRYEKIMDEISKLLALSLTEVQTVGNRNA
jgi:hypothetical protein